VVGNGSKVDSNGRRRLDPQGFAEMTPLSETSGCGSRKRSERVHEKGLAKIHADRSDRTKLFKMLLKNILYKFSFRKCMSKQPRFIPDVRGVHGQLRINQSGSTTGHTRCESAAVSGRERR